jgi:ParB family chromosome partitioning protein
VQSGVAGRGPSESGSSSRSPSRGSGEKDPDTRAFEKDLSDALGLKVEIVPGPGESGVLMIKYGNYEQLDYLRMRLTGAPSY